jgi:uncharacterized protein (TIGR03435 family)
MSSRLWIAIYLLVTCSLLCGQSPAPTPKFEVASIKPCKGEPTGQVHTSPGRLSFECSSVDDLIHGAFVMFAHGPFWRRIPGIIVPIPSVSPGELSLPIKGSSGWVQSERFTIDAKAPTATAEDLMRGPMMQQLLMDRFKLRIHREPAEVPVYELTVAKGGPRLQAAKSGNCIQQTPGGAPPDRPKGQPAPTPFCGGFGRSLNGAGVDSYGVTMPYLCLMLSMSMDGDVIDKTSLSGTFDIHLDMTLAELGFGLRGTHPATAPTDSPTGAPAMDPGGTLIDAVRKLGLQLRPAKKRVDAIVIDHVERPTAN